MKKEKEIINIRLRLEPSDKMKLKEAAEKEFRSLASQCRFVLMEWLKSKEDIYE